MSKFIVPDRLMIPLGAKATQELGKCADNWTDKEIAKYRVQLPVEYQSVSAEELRRRWITLRKNTTEGFRLNGHGPGLGSRETVTSLRAQLKAAEQRAEAWKELAKLERTCGDLCRRRELRKQLGE